MASDEVGSRPLVLSHEMPAWPVVVCAVLTAAGAVYAACGEVIVGVVGVALFGAASLLGAAEQYQPDRLELTDSGIAVRSVLRWRNMRWAWSEFSEFFPREFVFGIGTVGYRLARTSRHPVRRLNRWVYGVDGTFNYRYGGLGAMELADLLNRYRQACAGPMVAGSAAQQWAAQVGAPGSLPGSGQVIGPDQVTAPVVLWRSNKRLSRFITVGAVMVAWIVCLTLLPSAFAGWVGGVFAALLVIGLGIVRPDGLQLTESGFTRWSPRSRWPRQRTWWECGEFRPHRRWRRISYQRRLAVASEGVDERRERIPSGYGGMSAADLAALLNRYRQACGGQRPPVVASPPIIRPSRRF
ncbi:MAG: hypothetical protein FWD74_07210 [Actinomycetia bacterium]|nr:hypothetical protein [Actinomycetes bacterium]